MNDSSVRGDDFDALTFDCYGTIIDWERGLLDALGSWRTRTGVDLDDDALLQAFSAFETAVQSESPAAPYPLILGDVLSRIATRLGVDATDDEREAFGRSIGDWPPFPDSRDALVALGRRYKLIVASNVDRASFERSEARIGVRFDRLVAAGEVGAYKPDRRMFEAMLKATADFGAPRERVLHVAQSLFHDHVPAQALGLRTAHVDRRRGRGGGATPDPETPVTPDLTVETLAELVERLG